MTYKFVAFHTMLRGSGKPEYIVGCAEALAEKGASVLVVDGLMYEQGAIPLLLYEMLNSTVATPSAGKNLYDLVSDYETLCGEGNKPPGKLTREMGKKLTFPAIQMYQNLVFPEVCDRVSEVPGFERISYLAGNDGNVVEVKRRLDFHELFDARSGHKFFRYIREQLSGVYDYILLNAPAGHQEISGILCGQMADVIFAIDVDSPVVEADASYQTCRKLAQQIQNERLRPISVKSIKGHKVEEITAMIMEGANGP
jgi:hypothetical protein